MIPFYIRIEISSDSCFKLIYRKVNSFSVMLFLLLSITLTRIFLFSQGKEASCYNSILRSTKLLLFGDHKQLPPCVHSLGASQLNFSLMERVVDTLGDKVVHLLSTQYRMNEAIMKWSSEVMYAGKLIAHPSVANRILSDKKGIENTNITGENFRLK